MPFHTTVPYHIALNREHALCSIERSKTGPMRPALE
jgi:hypothetical protein